MVPTFMVASPNFAIVVAFVVLVEALALAVIAHKIACFNIETKA
jgi:hypothetical protein